MHTLRNELLEVPDSPKYEILHRTRDYRDEYQEKFSHTRIVVELAREIGHNLIVAL